MTVFRLIMAAAAMIAVVLVAKPLIDSRPQARCITVKGDGGDAVICVEIGDTSGITWRIETQGIGGGAMP